MENVTFNSPVCGVDALGRITPEPGTESTERSSRLVGLFYFLWLSEGNRRVFDISKIVAEHENAGARGDEDFWGRYGEYHYWGEPFYGYYSMTDEWVVRRHMKLIMSAGIDFLFFDTTNAVVYEPICHIVMKVLQEYADLGYKIPQVMFYTNTRSGWTAQRIYEEFYKPGLYRDTWFCLEGKPVIIAIPEECSDEVRAFFNVKLSQWPNEATKQGGWPWMDFEKPQRVFENLKGEPESINVSVAQHPQIHFGDSVLYGETANCGRAWHNGDNDRSENAYIMGYNFGEQFDRALETDPPIVLVTGWNEWIAGRWQGIPERPISFVDCANYEFSRDLEMMRDGYFDNYYMQLVSYVRKYKGARGVAPAAPGDVTVYPGFRDGGMARNCHGWTPEILFRNDTARCSLEKVAVSHNRKEISFAITADKIPADCMESFFQIFLSLGKKAGFDFVADRGRLYRINRAEAAPTVERACDLLTDRTEIGECGLSVDNGTVTVTLPLELLGLPADGTSELWFKVCVGSAKYEKVDDFYDKGDVLPMGRPCFVYRF